MVAIATASSDRFPNRPSRPVLVVLPPVARAGARTFRRRRLAVLLAALSLFALPALVLAAAGSTTATVVPASAPAPLPAAPPARTVYVVQPGDTLWSIAHKLEPQADPREVVDRLVELNGGAALHPGQRLRLGDE